MLSASVQDAGPALQAAIITYCASVPVTVHQLTKILLTAITCVENAAYWWQTPPSLNQLQRQSQTVQIVMELLCLQYRHI